MKDLAALPTLSTERDLQLELSDNSSVEITDSRAHKQNKGFWAEVVSHTLTAADVRVCVRWISCLLAICDYMD